MRAYFSFGSKIQGVIVQRNDSGRLKVLYSADNGYDERFVKPDVRVAVIDKWGIDTSKARRIWITVK